ncbi:replication-associated recombination protein A [Roseomonas sp. NAR14]|uniref:Replication-associated recombination protein A n=1 Tax=Roseomonas acroporae TaxID=2937791 RepID=A0A9X1Y4T9_9PROT|nr:replication-associated recombination protein A [Roseomonas acroporae]MCK8783085.1 replication-associated recombination protein A [Roseomonas acroporae]
MAARRPTSPPADPFPPDDLFGPAEPPAPRPAPRPADGHPGPRPLADRLRPRTLEEVVGQDHLLGPAGALTGMLARGSLASLVLWGPPGVGKTTIARLLAERAGLVFVSLSAVFSGVADLKRAFDEARQRRRLKQGTLLFVDEIHRFNRAQQDGFLPVVEDGTVTLVGATTENPSFALNGALLSRCQVLVLRRLDDPALELLLARAEEEAGRTLPLDEAARTALRAMADGDGRYLLNLAEQLLALPPERAPLDPAGLAALLAKRAALYDKDREEHYNLISALHKSMRGSDPDAALYWFARMLTGGEDPRYLARRLTRFAAEDVGAADPTALPLAIAAWETYERLGSPEGELALAQLVVHLAAAPKSNAVYVAFKAAMRAAKETGSLMPPAHILNAPTGLMRDLGYGAGYSYDHDEEEAFSGQNYFPDGMPRPEFYRPAGRGAEAAVAERLRRWAALRAGRAAGPEERRDDGPDRDRGRS